MEGTTMQPAAEFYDRLIAQEGPTPRGLALASSASQHLRFRAWLASVPVAPGDAVLDVGCGFADLYAYLHDAGHRGTYEGWDVSAAALDEARRRHPALEDRLHVRDALALPPSDAPRVDWVVCSGTFNVGMSDAQGIAALGPLLSLARKGLVASFQNAHGTHGPPAADGYRRAKYQPEAVYLHAKGLAPWVTLRDDYLPHDFLLAVTKRPHWDLVAGTDALQP